jgi:cyclohexa-1,5-dienecarbonyl-CoA hydratase
VNKVQLSYTHGNSVAKVILSDGKGNVLDKGMMLELLQVLDILGENKDVKLITFEGEGKHFSFGASVEEHTKEMAGDMIRTFHRIFRKIIDMSIPTAAKISGQCLGGGLELALICNFMFADGTASLGQPEIILGVFPPPASVILPLKIGSARTDDLLITGRSISAQEAQSFGLVGEVFINKDEMDARVDAWIEEHILPKSASSLRYALRAARSNFNKVFLEELKALEDVYLNQLMETKDANEGINAFIEKRKPVWENC